MFLIAACSLLGAGRPRDGAAGLATAHPAGAPCATPLPATTPMTTDMDMDMSMPMETPAAGGAATMAPMSGMSGMATSAAMPGMATGPDATMPAGSPAIHPDCAIAVSVREGDFFVQTGQTAFRVGQPYVFVVTNVGKVQHMFVIEPKGAVHQPLLRGKIMAMAHGIEPGQTITLAWTFAAPGAYQLACHEPGHYEAGMVEAVTVTS
jgi:uncharacterized cupredoxin-like copper-binding protein